jgi:hypothetical protein
LNGAQNPQLTSLGREFLSGSSDRLGADLYGSPVLGHVGEPVIDTVEVVAERESLGALPHELAGIEERLRCGIRPSQRS